MVDKDLYRNGVFHSLFEPSSCTILRHSSLSLISIGEHGEDQLLQEVQKIVRLIEFRFIGTSVREGNVLINRFLKFASCSLRSFSELCVWVTIVSSLFIFFPPFFPKQKQTLALYVCRPDSETDRQQIGAFACQLPFLLFVIWRPYLCSPLFRDGHVDIAFVWFRFRFCFLLPSPPSVRCVRGGEHRVREVHVALVL